MGSPSQSPLLKTGNGKSQQDDAARTYNFWYRVKDVVGVIVFGAIYYAQAKVLQTTQVNGVCGTPPQFVQAALIGGVALAVYPFYQQISIPPPPPDDAFFGLMAYFGRWIFLTRHCIVLQVYHMIASCVGAVFDVPEATHLSNGMTFWIGCLGTFVTIQFFTLVWPNAEFKERCMKMEATSPGMNFKRKVALMHCPGLLLTLLDAGILKARRIVQTECSFQATTYMIGGYSMFYIGLLFLNHRLSGEWPYGVLKALSPRGWVAFSVGQIALLVGFAAAVFCLCRLPPIWL